MIEAGKKAIEQGHQHILLFHGYLKACQLVGKRFYLDDMAEDIIIFFHLDGEEHVPHEQDVGQVFGLVDVA